MNKMQYAKNDILNHLTSEPNFLGNADATNILNNFFLTLEGLVKQNNVVKLNKFGSFKAGKKASKKARNFKTGEVIQTKECKKMTFIKTKLSAK